MRWLWPHLLLRLRLAGITLSWLSLLLLLALATIMVLEQAVYLNLRSEATVNGAWQRNMTCLSWDSSHLRLAHYQSTQRGQQGIPLLAGTLRKLEVGRALPPYDDPGGPSTGTWSFPGTKWWSSQNDGWNMSLSDWELMLLWPYPLLILAVPTLPAFGHIYRWMVRRYRIPARACPGCGYDLSATPDRCPECGAVVRFDPQIGRYRRADQHPRWMRVWLTRVGMATSLLGTIAVLVIWNGPGGSVDVRGGGPHVWLLPHQAICWYQYASAGRTSFGGEWHRATLGLWAQLDSSTIVLWIPYWFPLAVAGIAPFRAIWRRVRYGPVAGESPAAKTTSDSSTSS